MDIRKLFGTNRAAEEAGVWVPIGESTRVRIARDTSPAYRKKLQEVVRPYRGAIAANALDDKTAHGLFAKAAAGTILLGWEGVEDNGVAVPFTVEAAERVMSEVPDFYRAVKGFAEDASLFREQAEVAEAKN